MTRKILFSIACIAGAAILSPLSAQDNTPWHFRGLIQPRYEADLSEIAPGSVRENFFRVRRARASAKAQISQGLWANVQVEMAPEQVALLDAYFERRLGLEASGWRIRAGQFKKPYSLAELSSSSNLRMIDRPDISAFLASSLYSARDIGVLLSGKVGGKETPVAVQAGVFNGNGGSSSEDDDGGKWIGGRAEIAVAEALTIGANAVSNSFGIGGGVQRLETFGADVLLTPGMTTVVAEYNEGQRGPVTGDIFASSGLPRFRGFYVEALHRFGNAEPSARFEWLDRDTDRDDDAHFYLTFGLNWEVEQGLRLQVNYIADIAEADDVETTSGVVTQVTVKL